MVTSECGHAYRALRWEAPDWFQKPLPFEVKSIVELAGEWIASGRLAIDPAAYAPSVTYHDPCNISRNGGVIEEPRRASYPKIGSRRNLSSKSELPGASRMRR